MIGLATLLENIFPPTPSDFIVAFAAFLSHQGSLSAPAVFGIAWCTSVVGAIAVYVLFRRHGRRVSEGRLGRLLFPAAAVATMEREYLRFGAAGVFLTRLLPGFRSVVAPFAGLVGLPPATTLIATALASGLWYGTLTWAGVELGTSWPEIHRLLSGLNRTLAVISLLILGAIGITVWRRRRGLPSPSSALLHQIFVGDETAEAKARMDPAVVVAVTLLAELARTDRPLTANDRKVVESYLRLHDRSARFAILAGLRRMVHKDGALDERAARLLQRSADLLGLSAEEITDAAPPLGR